MVKMSTQSSYYKLISEWLDKSKYLLQSNADKSYLSKDCSSKLLESENNNLSEYNKTNNDSKYENHEEELKIWHDFAVKLYFSKLNNAIKEQKSDIAKLLRTLWIILLI